MDLPPGTPELPSDTTVAKVQESLKSLNPAMIAGMVQRAQQESQAIRDALKRIEDNQRVMATKLFILEGGKLDNRIPLEKRIIDLQRGNE